MCLNDAGSIDLEGLPHAGTMHRVTGTEHHRLAGHLPVLPWLVPELVAAWEMTAPGGATVAGWS